MWLLIVAVISIFAFLLYSQKSEELVNSCRFWLWVAACWWTQRQLPNHLAGTRKFKNFWEALVPTEEELQLERPLVKAESNLRDTVEFFGSSFDGTHNVFIHLSSSDDCQECAFVLKIGDHSYTLPKTRFPKRINHKDAFVGPGIRLEALDTFQTWRISFNGRLKCMDSSSRSEVFVKANFIWATNSDVQNVLKETSSRLLANNLIGNCPKRTSSIVQTTFAAAGSLALEQWGQFAGEITLGDQTVDVVLYGLRKHYRVSTKCTKQKFISAVGYCKNGLRFHAGSMVMRLPDDKSGGIPIKYGYVVRPNRLSNAVVNHQLEPKCFAFEDEQKHYVSFRTDRQAYLVTAKSENVIPLRLHGLKCRAWFCNMLANGEAGYGMVIEADEPDDVNQVEVGTVCAYETPTLTCDEAKMLVVPLSHRACGNNTLCGGKGANLAKLRSLELTFTVPNGFCVTTTAYSHFLEANKSIVGILASLEKAAWQLTTEKLQTVSQDIGTAFVQSTLPDAIRHAIVSELQRSFSEFENTAFAVRSSAVGEDNADLSAAGQMETFLGVKGLEPIISSILKCWASQYSVPALQYKRQHGQPICSLMGVVVQEMVHADAAGVLFMCDPLTGDPNKIVINSSFGLGESVVAGNAEPDTFVLERNCDGMLTIIERSIGHKDFELVEKDDGGTEELKIAAGRSEQSSLTDANALHISEICAVLQSQLGGDPIDVEWAFSRNALYILQVRPITTADIETDFELLHEFDCGTLAETDIYTTGNIGEGCPLPCSPLTHSVVLPLMDAVIRALFYYQEKHAYFKTTVTSYRNRLFINLADGFYRNVVWQDDHRAPEVVLLGHIVDKATLPDIRNRRFERDDVAGNGEQIVSMCKWLFWAVEKLQRDYDARYQGTHLIREKLKGVSDVKAMFNALNESAEQIYYAWLLHMMASARSSLTYNVIFAALLNKFKEWTPEHYADISTLYASAQQVVSADVPSAIKELAHAIESTGQVSKFRAMSPETAIAWLRSTDSSPADRSFAEFLDKHGHRSLCEIDLWSQAWAMDPSPLITILQNLLKDTSSLRQRSSDLSVEEAINRLHTPVSSSIKWLLKWMVPKARQAVAKREETKSIGIKAQYEIKLAYRQLGQRLCEQGYLPDVDLLFFFTQAELQRVINERPAKLIAKALRRRKLMKLQEEQVYPELMFGCPQPELPSSAGSEIAHVLASISGTPVCQGIAKGRARVARTLDEARDTQPGEVLITRSTDIGWSPYFPLVAGVVTEIGGLLSHGAVVAREYGLPCLINAKNATGIFRTGDLVLLDATKGKLEKLEG